MNLHLEKESGTQMEKIFFLLYIFSCFTRFLKTFHFDLFIDSQAVFELVHIMSKVSFIQLPPMVVAAI